MIVLMRSMSFCIDVAARLQWQSIKEKRNEQIDDKDNTKFLFLI